MNKQFIALTAPLAVCAWMWLGLFSGQAAPETNTPVAVKDAQADKTWFSWWGPAKPDTNAPLVASQPAVTAQEPPKSKAAAVVQSDSAEAGPQSKVAQSKESKGWFSWWGRAKPTTAEAPKVKERAAPSRTIKPDAIAAESLKPARPIKASSDTKPGIASPAAPASDVSSPWRFAAGVLQRRIGRTASVAADSFSRHESIPTYGMNRTQHGRNPGAMNGFADREYDNGYVFMDAWTALDGGTKMWGLENGGQVHDGYVEFNVMTGERSTRSRVIEATACNWEKSSDREWAGFAAVDWLFFQRQGFSVGLGLNASRASFSSAGVGSTFYDHQSWQTVRTTVSDQYALTGAGFVADPTAWAAEESRPVIDNIPVQRTTRSQVTESGSYTAFNAVSQTIAMDLYTLSAGVSLGFDWWRLQVAGMAGPTVNYVDADGVYAEALYANQAGGDATIVNTWRASHAEAEFMTGFYLQAGLFYNVYRGLQLGVFGRYDWLEDFLGSVGPLQYTVSPSGGSYGASLGVNF